MSRELASPRVSRINRFLPIAVSYLLVVIMMVCFSGVVASIGERLFLAWNSSYLILIALFITLEVLITHRATAETPLLSPEWLLYRFTEWVFNAIAIKLIIYATQGFSQLLIDVKLWQDNFFGSFFNTDYVVTLIFAMCLWLLDGQFANLLQQLEHDPDQLDLERQGYGLKNRQAVRQQLMGMIFSLGGLMLVVTALINVDLSAIDIHTFPVRPHVWLLFIYFVCGFALLALTQFDVLRSYWYLHNIPIAPSLAARWIFYAVCVLVLFSIIASLLPTRYSIGLLDLIAWVISLFASLLALLEMLILTPFIYILRLFARLFGMNSEPDQGGANPIFPPPQIVEPGVQTPLLEVLKSLVFWLIFLGVVLFFLIQYIRQRKDWIQSLSGYPILGWIGRFWQWLRGWLGNVGTEIATTIGERWQTLRRQRLRQEIGRANKRTHSGSLSPREQIMAYYLSMVEQNQAMDLLRKPAQTPNEYAKDIENIIPEAGSEVEGFTSDFLEARYSQHDIPPLRVEQSRSYWDVIREKLAEWKTGNKKE